VKIRPPVFAVGDDKKKREGEEREGKVHKVTSRLYFTNMGSRPLGPISTKIGKVVGVHDVINHTKFGFNIFRGFRSTGGQNFCFPIDFAGHRYNSAAATAQPVITIHFDRSVSFCTNITALRLQRSRRNRKPRLCYQTSSNIALKGLNKFSLYGSLYWLG